MTRTLGFSRVWDRAVSDRIGVTQALGGKLDPVMTGNAHQAMQAGLWLCAHPQPLGRQYSAEVG